MDTADLIRAATTLRSILDAIGRGELAAEGPQGKALVRRLEGAVAALEEAAKAR